MSSENVVLEIQFDDMYQTNLNLKLFENTLNLMIFWRTNRHISSLKKNTEQFFIFWKNAVDDFIVNVSIEKPIITA